MRAYLIVSLLVLGAAAPTAAQAEDSILSNRLHVPRDQWLPPAQIAEKLTQQGYKVTEIEADDGVYEVEMTDKNGLRVEGHVHPATAELLVGYDND